MTKQTDRAIFGGIFQDKIGRLGEPRNVFLQPRMGTNTHELVAFGDIECQRHSHQPKKLRHAERSRSVSLMPPPRKNVTSLRQSRVWSSLWLIQRNRGCPMFFIVFVNSVERTQMLRLRCAPLSMTLQQKTNKLSNSQ